jgi:tripartite-type tricarboxylate transporter receptor subunit TctC
MKIELALKAIDKKPFKSARRANSGQTHTQMFEWLEAFAADRMSVWTSMKSAAACVSNRILGGQWKLAARLLALALGVAGTVPAHAQPSSSAVGSSARAYPERPVRVVVPLPAGGSTDTIVRALALRLTEAFGQTFVVDNRPGAGSLVGLDILASAAPDGYTLMAIGGTTVMYPLLYKSRHDIGRDFAPVAQLSAHGYVMVIHPSLPAKSVPEFVKYLKANPDKINYSSSGIGSPLHMSGELFKLLTGTRMTHVPYKGTAAAYADLLSGQVQVSFPTIISSRGHIRANRLRPLAVTRTKRVSALPNVPTFEETGLNGMIVEGFYAIMAPQKTPQAIIERLAAEINKAMRTPEVVKSLAADGAEAAPGSPAELAVHIKSELERWSKVVRSVGIKVQ